MKKFKDLSIGDTIYCCNFFEDNIKTYEVLNIKNSKYENQLTLWLHDKANKYSPDYVNEIVHVFKDKSCDTVKGMVSDGKTLFCVNKQSVNEQFNSYCNTITNELQKKKEMILRL